jgi:hypothetical protein
MRMRRIKMRVRKQRIGAMKPGIFDFKREDLPLLPGPQSAVALR